MWRLWLLFDPRRVLIGLFTFLFGLAVLIGIAWLFSNNKKAVDWKLVLTGLGLQIAQVECVGLDLLQHGALRF